MAETGKEYSIAELDELHEQERQAFVDLERNRLGKGDIDPDANPDSLRLNVETQEHLGFIACGERQTPVFTAADRPQDRSLAAAFDPDYGTFLGYFDSGLAKTVATDYSRGYRHEITPLHSKRPERKKDRIFHKAHDPETGQVIGYFFEDEAGDPPLPTDII